MGQLHGGHRRGHAIAGGRLGRHAADAERERPGNVLDDETFAEHLVGSNHPGSIVAISSMNGQGLYVPVQPQSAYNASKAAIKGLVGPLAGELGQYGIRVNCISPGAIQTPLLARLEGKKRATLDWYKEGAPLQRLGVPEDLTPMVCYLLSDAASFTTGAEMLVTGGLHAGLVRK